MNARAAVRRWRYRGRHRPGVRPTQPPQQMEPRRRRDMALAA